MSKCKLLKEDGTCGDAEGFCIGWINWDILHRQTKPCDWFCLRTKEDREFFGKWIHVKEENRKENK
ncbi:hypothetical protein HY745_13360 [Candidatus Desantisbacteria bacterium]|nr:hypothetical protein [Candidatus Desantisbacteria bacterium]